MPKCLFCKKEIDCLLFEDDKYFCPLCNHQYSYKELKTLIKNNNGNEIKTISKQVEKTKEKVNNNK